MGYLYTIGYGTGIKDDEIVVKNTKNLPDWYLRKEVKIENQLTP
jgi:hypothetical protein